MTKSLEFSPLPAIERSPVRSTPLHRASLGPRTKKSCEYFQPAYRALAGRHGRRGGSARVWLDAPASSSPSANTSPSASAPKVLTAKQIAFGTLLKHTFQPNGTGASQPSTLSSRTTSWPLAATSTSGSRTASARRESRAVPATWTAPLSSSRPPGSVVKQWDVTGKIDGMGADPATGRVFATVNEDSKSSLYVESGGTVTHYTYSQSPLPHMGGTDAVSVYQGKILISASAPGTGGKAPKSAPAVFVATLNAANKTASLAPFFADNATATGVNGSTAGTKVTLALADPDSNEIVPSSSPKFAGDFMLNSQGDQELIFTGASGSNLQVLKIPQPVDDTAFATSASGSLYTTDSSADTVDVITGPIKPGTAYTAITPCNANAAPAVCPASSAPQYGPNSLGTINLVTGAVSKVTYQRGGHAQGHDLRAVATRPDPARRGPPAHWRPPFHSRLFEASADHNHYGRSARLLCNYSQVWTIAASEPPFALPIDLGAGPAGPWPTRPSLGNRSITVRIRRHRCGDFLRRDVDSRGRAS